MPSPLEDQNLLAAVKLLNTYTAGRFDIWALAGRSKATCRQHVMTALMNGPDGKKIPQAKSGVTMLRTEFYNRIGIKGDCIAAREKNFVEWCETHCPE